MFEYVKNSVIDFKVSSYHFFNIVTVNELAF